MLTAKPVPVRLFRDIESGRLYRSHYLGMSDSCVVDAGDIEGLVVGLIDDGTLVVSNKMIHGEEICFVDRDGNRTEATITGIIRRGRGIELA